MDQLNHSRIKFTRKTSEQRYVEAKARWKMLYPEVDASDYFEIMRYHVMEFDLGLWKIDQADYEQRRYIRWMMKKN